MDKGGISHFFSMGVREGSGIFSDQRGVSSPQGGSGLSSPDKRGGGSPNTIWVSNDTYSRLLNGFLLSIFIYLLLKVIYFLNGIS